MKREYLAAVWQHYKHHNSKQRALTTCIVHAMVRKTYQNIYACTVYSLTESLVGTEVRQIV